MSRIHTRGISDKYFFAYKRGNLSNYRTALKSENCKILFLGDSVTEGFYASLKYRDSYVPKFRDLMQAKYGSLGYGYLNHNEERVAYTGTWIQTTGGILDWARRGESQATATVTTTACTSITVIYNKETIAGTFTVTIDGVNYSVNANGSHQAGVKYTINGLPNTAHTVVIKAPPAGATPYVYFLGLILDNPEDKGVQVHQIGKAGYAPYDLLSLANKDELLRIAIDDFSPHLTVLAWGDNEPERNPTEFKQDVKDFITRALNFGDVLLLGEPQVSHADRVAKQYELADEYPNRVAMVDMRKALNGSHRTIDRTGNIYFSGGSPGTVGSDVHPSNAGHERMSKVLFSILG